LEKLESVIYKMGSNNLQPIVPVRLCQMLSRFSVASICLLAALVVFGQTPICSLPACQARTVVMAADDDSSQGLSRDASWETPEANKVIDSSTRLTQTPSPRIRRSVWTWLSMALP